MMPKLKSHPITKWLNKNGWSYHKHQIDTLEEATKGYDILLVAPTGGGKTLAGFMPAITDLIEKKYKDNFLHTLYISPLKALTVDVQRNLVQPINDQSLNISVETRTGDTPYAKKRRQKTSPPQMLMTTPESFALLMSDENAEDYFKNIKFLIIDEIHTLINSKRGDLLSLNIARLNELASNYTKIGLSATIKDKENVLNFLSQNKQKKIIDIPSLNKPKVEILMSDDRIPWSGHMATYSIKTLYTKIEKAEMSIIFVNTRAQAELIFHNLWLENKSNLKIAVHHGSLEREIRRKVEQKMSKGEIDCVVATSSLDLGIDWAKIDLVIQVGAPKGVSRLLQRIGRSNHTLNKPSKALLVPGNRFEYLECLAAIEAIKENIIDGDNLKSGSLDVLAQHILGVACSNPFDKTKLYKNVKTAWPYRKLSVEDFTQTLEFVQNGGYSLRQYQKYSKIGLNKNNQFAIRNKTVRQKYKMNIGTIVESYMLKVKLRNKTLGNIEEWFIEGLTEGDTFLFGGKVLKFLNISEKGVHVALTKDKRPKIPSYAGGRMPLTSELASQVKKLISKKQSLNSYPEQIKDWLILQSQKSILPMHDKVLIETFPRKMGNKKRHFLICYAFEGRNVHQTLGFLISKRMQRYNLKPLGFVATDYALAIWSMKEINDVKSLFNEDLMISDLYEWLDDTPLMKKNFRDAAIISGLIERKMPGLTKTSKQILFNTDLIYDVLKKHEGNHLLLKVAKEDSLNGLISIDRLGKLMKRIQNKILFKKLEKISPLAVPLLLEINRETINKDELNEYYLEEFENELLREIGFS